MDTFINFLQDNFDITPREVSIAFERLQEAKMWLGKYLGTLPEGGEDLNAARDAKEVDASRPQYNDEPANTESDAAPETANEETPEPAAVAPAEGNPAPAGTEQTPSSNEEAQPQA